jgi:hypothetical protein
VRETERVTIHPDIDKSKRAKCHYAYHNRPSFEGVCVDHSRVCTAPLVQVRVSARQDGLDAVLKECTVELAHVAIPDYTVRIDKERRR